MSTRIKQIITIIAIILSMPIIKIILMATINVGLYLGILIRTICEKIVI